MIEAEDTVQSSAPPDDAAPCTVAVLLCLYRGDDPQQLRESVNSIQQQTWRHLDLYIHVDGPISTDLDHALAEFADDPRIRIRRGETNQGLAHSLNALIEEVVTGARAAYVARMDADDIALPERLERQVAHLEAHPEIDVLGTGCIEFREEDGTMIRKTRRLPTDDATLKRRIVQRTPFVHPTVMFRRSVFDAGIRYRVDNYRSEDTFLWADLTERGCVFANLPEPLLYYRFSRDVVKRRQSFSKAVSDLRGRIYMMRRLDKVTPSNIAASIGHFGLKLLPTSLLEAIYRLRS